MVQMIENGILPLEPPATGVEKAGRPRVMRVKRLDRPNKALLDENVSKVFGDVVLLQNRIAEIKVTLENKQQNKHVVSQDVLDARNMLSDLVSSFRSVMDEKRALKEELDLADKMRERMRADARALREKLPYVKVEQIDEEIKKLDYRISHTSMSMQDEKKLLQQMRDLTKSRDFVKDYNDRMGLITLDESSRGELLEKIREKDQILNKLKVQQEEQRQFLAEIKARDALNAVDIPVLIDERHAAFDKIKSLKESIKELKSEFRSREDEFWEREREWKEQQAIEKRLKYEKMVLERLAREKLRKQREMENFVEPFTDEIIICDQLIGYLQKFAPAVEETANASGVSSKAEILAPQGVGNVIVSKKNRSDEELDGWFAGFGSKVKGKKTKSIPAPKSKEKERLSLSLDALTSFEKVKLSPPTVVGDVAKSIDELKSGKEKFLKLQTDAREKREREEVSSESTKQGPNLVGSTIVEKEGQAIAVSEPLADDADKMHEEVEFCTLTDDLNLEMHEGEIVQIRQENEFH